MATWLTVSGENSLTQVLALKFGYENVQDMMVDSRKRFSLLENGILDQPSTRLFLVNVSVHPEDFPLTNPLTYRSGQARRTLPHRRRPLDIGAW